MSQKDRVLVVEDESDVVDLIRYNLSRAGFEVFVAPDGPSGVEAAKAHRPDVIVLDLMLPGFDGHEVCQRVRSDPETARTGILMLTAKGEPDHRVRGLESGADDYMGKPFSPRELILRLQALSRRLKAPPSSPSLEFDGIAVDKTLFEIRVDGRKLDLTNIEFKLLSLLLDRRGRVQSREQLLADVWGYNNAIDTRTVDTHIRRLREKLGDKSHRLETVRGEGYLFRAG